MSAESFLLTLPRFADKGVLAMKPGLERISALLEGIARPQDRYPAVLVAGTNGKGSTASMLAAIATAAGLRTGLHTSPHLFTLRERMRVDGEPAPEDWLEDAVARHRGLITRTEPSFFEATVALSLLYFAEKEVDVAVVEVGLGGRLDATNILEPELCLVTHIARDHEELLGATLPVIAREKAGIARPGVPFLTSETPGEALDALVDEAARREATVEVIRESIALETTGGEQEIDLETPRQRYRALRLGLQGSHQAWNAALSVRAAEYLLVSLVDAEGFETVVRRGIGHVRELAGLAGRSEILQERPVVMVDVAHNPDGLEAALEAFRSIVPGSKTVLLGLMRDKHPADVARLFARADLRIASVYLTGDRALPRSELEGYLLAAGANVVESMGVRDAVERFHRTAAPDDGLLATGSHQVVAEAIAAMRRRPL